MLNSIIRFSLRQSWLILALAGLLILLAVWEGAQLPIDVFPDLNRPRVVVLTEAPGLAPEEVEALINVPLESVLNGATGVEAVRSSASVGISVIYVEFSWGSDIFVGRQIVNERIHLVLDRIPEGIQPHLAPISSIMGQIMLVGMRLSNDADPDGDTTLDNDATLKKQKDPAKRTTLLQLRQYADWVVRQRLLNIKGVAQVFVMGGENGGRRQVQALIDPDKLRRLGITLHQVEEALAQSNQNATGGYFPQGTDELLVRSLGRVESLEDLKLLVVDGTRSPPVLLEQLARIVNGPETPRGMAAVGGEPAVMMVIAKQPGANTRVLSKEILDALDEVASSLPSDVQVNPHIYRMDQFIDRAIENVIEALRDGSILVVIILLVFLMSFRTTLITLTAIPLSIAVTLLVFRWYGMSINTMTLGGLAVAIGELVDDAIVDVENIYRRLRQNQESTTPKPALEVVFRASVEIRGSIVFGTLIVVLVFIPLFALSGIEGRIFSPLAVSYIVSILASLLVSLTVTPVLCYFLLSHSSMLKRTREGPVLRGLQSLAEHTIRWSLRHRGIVLVSAAVAAGASVVTVSSLGRTFLPPFHEGSVQVNLVLRPGTSLETSNRIATQVDRALAKLDDVIHVGRRTGRAEDDEHSEGVHVSEIILTLKTDSIHSREQQLQLIRQTLDSIPGAESSAGRSSTEQPIAHLISHMLSGVRAQIAIKIFGDDLAVLRDLAESVRAAIDGTVGVVDLAVEQQVLIPQLQIQLDRQKLAHRGLRTGQVNHMIETAMNGRVVSQILEGQATFDLVVRLDDPFRLSLDALSNLAIELPSGGSVPLSDVAQIYPDRVGPNTINREDGRRRIVVQCNASDRSLSEVRDDIQRRIAPIEAQLPQYGPGYSLRYSGQFESQERAAALIAWLSLISITGIFLVLFTLFRSVNLALQVMVALPMAAIGAVAALVITGQSLSVPSIVGFISLAGIASRNGILLIAHYLHLVRHEGEAITSAMIVRAGKERVAPVLMTALTSGIGLLPLALAAGQPGKEILYPVATVILGGLISSTLLEFLVRPALFWTFGQKAAQRAVEHTDDDLAS